MRNKKTLTFAGEYFIRLLQEFFGCAFFEIPGLRKIRESVYCKVLHIKKPVNFISKHVVFSRNHLSVAHGRETSEKEYGTIKIGRKVAISADVKVDFTGGVAIGDNVDIADGVRIYTHKHILCSERMTFLPKTIEPSFLTIEDNVWIGAGSIILPAVCRIGRNVIIGAGSVVTKDVPDNVVLAGNPAVVKRELKADEIIHG